MGNGSQPIAHSAVRPDVRFGSLADICAAKSDVRFSPNSDRKSGFAHEVMSALLPKADMCGATMDVRFGPEADITGVLFNYLVGAKQGRRWNDDTKCFCGLEIQDEFKSGRRFDRCFRGIGSQQYPGRHNTLLSYNRMKAWSVRHQSTIAGEFSE
jgi:hypothetical protein